MSDEFEIGVTRLGPGDVLVISTPRPVSTAAMDKLRQKVREKFPLNEVMVLEAGVQLEIVRPQPFSYNDFAYPGE
jgi:hypothetical protein